MNITFRQIECFHHAMLLRSTVAASEVLGISQPSVSRAISELEEQVGFLLFTRDGKGLKPTSDGAALYESVQRVLDGIAEVKRTAAAIKNREVGKIRIISLPSFADTFVAPVVAEFLTQFPRVRVEMDQGGTDLPPSAVPTESRKSGVARLVDLRCG